MQFGRTTKVPVAEMCKPAHLTTDRILYRSGHSFRQILGPSNSVEMLQKAKLATCWLNPQTCRFPSSSLATQRGLCTFSQNRTPANAEALKETVTMKLKDAPTLKDFLAESNSSCASSGPEQGGDAVASAKEPVLQERKRLPPWIRSAARTGGAQYLELKKSLKSLKLNTVCEEAKCVNINECWGGTVVKESDGAKLLQEHKEESEERRMATATIMLMGDTCTRGCRFCAVKTSRAPPPLDPDEPKRTAEAVAQWGVDYLVITTVDRDDLQDSGAAHFAETVRLIKQSKPGILLEALTGDFKGDLKAAEQVIDAGLDVFAHNVETVRELQAWIRDRRASWQQSTNLLQHAKRYKPSLIVKTSLMLGVGETDEEVRGALENLRAIGVDAVTIGQYLQPTRRHMKVDSYVHPDKFDYWRQEGEKMGFLYVASGPMVRSSYRAGEFYLKKVLQSRRSVTDSL